jgi:aminobenzoyl-glutamate transport protein
VVAQSFFTKEGLIWILGNLIKNFTGYAPLGLVLVMTIGIGLCEEVGLINTLIRKAMSGIPAPVVPYATIAIGVMAQIASDSATLIIPPLAGALYLSLGRHPICGCLTGYAGTTLGYLANPIITGTDALAVGITNSALKTILPDMQLDALCNWYFKVASTVFLAVALGFVSDKIVEKRFGKYTGKAAATANASDQPTGITEKEKKGLRVAGVAALVYIALLIWGMFVPGLLLHEKTGLLGSNFLSGIIPIIWTLFFTCGLAYGIAAGTVKSEADVSKALTRRMSTLGSYIIMAFMAGQFTALFDWSKMGVLLSISGAQGLKASGFTGFPLILCFIWFVALVDFLMSSASAKWALMAPVFVPMFAMIGYHPAFTQVAYRVGDSAANIMSPTSAFLWMLLDQCKEKYDPNVTIGNFLTTQFMFFIVSQIGWAIIIVVWMFLNLPVGPGCPIYLPAGLLTI